MATLIFHKSLYPADAVQSAAAAYSELATFALEGEDHRTTVTISDIDADFADFPDEFEDAFANHALFEAIRLHREGAAS